MQYFVSVHYSVPEKYKSEDTFKDAAVVALFGTRTDAMVFAQLLSEGKGAERHPLDFVFVGENGRATPIHTIPVSK